LKIAGDNVGRYLDVIGVDAYEARGGKVTLDLFGTDHQVSDTALLKAMITEKAEQACAALIADGWSFAQVGRPENSYLYGKLEPKVTTAQSKRVKELQAICNATDEGPELDKAEAELATVEAEIERAAYTAEQKKKGGCFVVLDANGIKIESGRVEPKVAKA